MTAGVTAFLHLMVIFYDVSTPPFHAAPNPLYTFNKVHTNTLFLTSFATFFIADYKIIVCFLTIFSKKTKFHTKRESCSKMICHFAAWGGGYGSGVC